MDVNDFFFLVFSSTQMFTYPLAIHVRTTNAYTNTELKKKKKIVTDSVFVFVCGD